MPVPDHGNHPQSYRGAAALAIPFRRHLDIHKRIRKKRKRNGIRMEKFFSGVIVLKKLKSTQEMM
jgi:hypothetical protein